jgi:TonB family protein
MRLPLVCLALLMWTSAAEASVNTPPRPLGSPGDWVTDHDYPANALRNNIVGTSGFRLTISLDGTVSSCSITQTSGSAELDTATCTLVSQRARFEPSRDEEGQPVVSNYSNRVRWVIPNGVPVAVHNLVIEFDVEPDGSIVNCNAKIAPPIAAKPVCESMHQAFFVDADQANKNGQGRRHVIVRDSVTIDGPRAVKSTGSGRKLK